jgi:hypothetical protein
MRQTQMLLTFGTRRNDTTDRKELHEYEKFIGRLMMLLCNPKSCAHIIGGGWNENGVKTDGTKWYHICFHIFMWKQKQIEKHQKQI